MADTVGPGEVTFVRDDEQMTWILSGELRIDGLLKAGWQIDDQQ